MIGLIALVGASQALPWLDRNWINHQAHREMLVAASVSIFDPDARPHPHGGGQIRIAVPREKAIVARRAVGLGGPAGM